MTNNKETNRERFVRIVERRVNAILTNLDSLGKCSNRKNYEYTDNDIRMIFNEIDKKTKEVKNMFNGQNKELKVFKLKR